MIKFIIASRIDIWVIKKFILIKISKNINDSEKVLLSGGGTYNKNLVAILQKEYSINTHIPEKQIIDFKEALIFGFLFHLRNDQ